MNIYRKMIQNSPEPDQGKVGTFAVWATNDEAILSPKAHIAFSFGPINAILFLWSNSGSFGFSEAWPHPAHTAFK